MGNFDKKRAFGIGGAIAVLTSIIAVVANVSEIIQLFRSDDKPEVSTSARTQIVEEVSEETVVEQADIIEAENIAEVVEEAPPTEAQPKAVYLDSLKIAEKSYNVRENISDAVDTIGNTYSVHTLTIGDAMFYTEDYATYYLGGKYKTLSGVIAVHDDTYGDNTGELSILCDDNVVYSTGIIGRTSIPTEFTVSVEGCQWLKIYHSKFPIKFIISDFKLE